MTMANLPREEAPRFDEMPARSAGWRRWKNVGFVVVCIITALVSVSVLGVLLTSILIQGLPGLSAHFLSNSPSPYPEEAGIYPALFGTIWVCVVCAVFALPIGVGTAVFLEEFRPTQRFLRWLHGFVQLNISNLAGVPSVVYGILGLTAFVSMFGLFGRANDPAFEFGVRYYDQFVTEGGEVLLIPVADRRAPMTKIESGMTVPTSDGRQITLHVIGPDDPYPTDDETLRRALYHDAEAGRNEDASWYYFRLPFGRGVLAAGLTLMLVILPVVIIASQEAIRAVPDSLREAALGMGATRWQVVWNVTLPAAVPGIMTGSILAMSRAIGEAAPILIILGTVFITWAPEHLMDEFAVMPVQIYTWAGEANKDFHTIAASGIIILLGVLFVFNAAAVFIRYKFQKPLS